MNLDDIKNLWAVFAGIVSAILAGMLHVMKINGEVTRLRDDYEQQRLDHEKKVDAMWSKIDTLQQTMMSILQSLARLEGKLEVRHNSERKP